mgnify:CR=1 FL=1
MTTSTSTSPLATPVPPRAAPRPQIDPRYIPPMLITLILLGSNFLTGKGNLDCGVGGSACTHVGRSRPWSLPCDP